MVNLKLSNLTSITGASVSSANDQLYIRDASVTNADQSKSITVAELFNVYSPPAHSHVSATTTNNGYMTSTDKIKLDGVEAGATADQTAAEILAALLTVDGPGTGIDADLLDGMDSSAFSPVSHTHVSATTTNNGYMTSTDKTKLDGVETGATADQTALEIRAALLTVDGPGTGIDADLLDGMDSSAFSPVSHTHVSATTTNNGYMTSADKTKLDGVESGATADQTAAEILTALKTVDGTTSGLDADLLDGMDSSAFATSSHTHADASEAVKGLIEIATAAEALAGTSTTLALTPAHLAGNKSLAANGYYQFPGGFTVQWGNATTTSSVLVTFPVAFTTVYGVIQTVDLETNHWITGLSTTQFTVHIGGSSSTKHYWIAVGHKS